MLKVTLEKPTVAQIITLLQALPPDTPFLMRDADTDWTIEVTHVEQNTEGVWFFGSYEEM